MRPDQQQEFEEDQFTEFVNRDGWAEFESIALEDPGEFDA